MAETIEELLERKFPRIEWRKPLHVASPQGKGLACRFCIARHGLRAADIPSLSQSVAEFHAHMNAFHPVTVAHTVAHVAQNSPSDTHSASLRRTKNDRKAHKNAYFIAFVGWRRRVVVETTIHY